MKTILHTLLTALVLINLLACNNTSTKEPQNKATEFATLKERNADLSKTEEWALIKEKANLLLDKIKANPNDTKSKLLLAQLYMQEARITGEHPYYYPATLVILDDILMTDSANFEALAFKASVQLSLHHFAEALETGTKGKNINSDNGFIFGVLCDANVELGNYDEAVKMSERMQSLRPGLEAYSRASYLREIYGNNEGAIEAMKMAYQAGLPASEEAAWAGNTLAHLLENTGDLKNAELVAKSILEQRPSYAFATASLGRIELARKNYDKAIELLENATKQMPEFSFYEGMAKAYKAKGQTEKAKEIYKDVINMLKEDAASGHYADMELAWVYLEIDDMENAMKHATIEYERRPENIDANKTMAWVLYKKGNAVEAKKYMDKATRLKTQNADLMAKAGIIESAVGNKKMGEEMIAKAKKINPFVQIAI